MCKVLCWICRQLRHHPRLTASIAIVVILVTIVTALVLNQLSPVDQPASFNRSLTDAEHSQLMRSFASVMAALDAANVTYWMNGGTLLGSYRHHGIIPWDDDIDLIVRHADKRLAYNALKQLAPEYELYVYHNDIQLPWAWRFYPANGDRIGILTLLHGWRFPLVDLLFYVENSTHVWSMSYDNEVWLKSTIFPLNRRPFGDLLAPAPCDVPTHLTADYSDVTQCQTALIGHRDFRWKKNIASVNCSDLESMHPFVRRRPASREGYVIETLVQVNGSVGLERLLVADCRTTVSGVSTVKQP